MSGRKLSELVDDPDPNWLNVSLVLGAFLVVILVALIFVAGLVAILSHLRWE